MSDDDNIIRLQNVGTVHIPEIQNRNGTVTLHYGGAEETETVEISGTITLSEVCFLYMILGKYINDKLGEP